MSTTAKQLEDYAEKLDIKLNGIYFKDELPVPPAGKQLEEGGYIINLDSYPGNGTHWTALWIYPTADNVSKSNQTVRNRSQKQMALYFDSFGLWPPDNVEKWLKKNGFDGYMMSSKQIQNIRSGYCGQYCILFLYYMSRSQGEQGGFTEFISLFTL